MVNSHTPHLSADCAVVGENKGKTIDFIRQKLGIQKENVYAFGDGKNDPEMLLAAGHGIAMGNSVEELKEIAEYVTTNRKRDEM